MGRSCRSARGHIGSDGAAVDLHIDWGGAFGDGRPVLWNLPSDARVEAGPDHCAAGGKIIMTKLAFVNGIVLALQTIRNHKLRAFLTVLGVIIGTGTIIGV